MGWKLCGDKKERGLVLCRNRRRGWKGMEKKGLGGISTYLIAYKHTAEVGINLRFSVILVQIKATAWCMYLRYIFDTHKLFKKPHFKIMQRFYITARLVENETSLDGFEFSYRKSRTILLESEKRWRKSNDFSSRIFYIRLFNAKWKSKLLNNFYRH